MPELRRLSAPLRLRDDMAGKKIKCPLCSAVFRLPEEVEDLEPVASVASAVTAASEKPRRREAEPGGLARTGMPGALDGN